MQKDCSCKVFLSSDCVNDVKAVFTCLNIQSGLSLTETLEEMDAQICEKFGDIGNSFSLINVGTGVAIYKGVNLAGNKEIKSLLAEEGGLLTITNNTNEVLLAIDTDALLDYVAQNQRTYTVSNLEGGTPIYKEAETVGTNIDFKLRPIKSSTLTVGIEGDAITIETPDESDIPRLIVNSAYTGDEQLGTLSKPFKTIQGALDAFVGGVGFSNENPEMAGAEVVIQKGVGAYNFTGNFNYNTLTLILEEGTTVTSNPSVGNFLCDFDTMSDSLNTLDIILKDKSELILEKSGFRNAGTTVTTNNINIFKRITISGTGLLYQNSSDTTVNQYTIFESNYTNTNTFNNDGGSSIQVRGVEVKTNTQSVYKVGGNARISINKSTIQVQAYILLPTSTVFFSQLGGSCLIDNCTLVVAPYYNVTLDKIFSLSKSVSINCEFQMINVLVTGRMNTLIYNETNLQASATLVGTQTKRNLTQCVFVAQAPLTKWSELYAYNNVFISGAILPSQIDLTANNTISSYNIFEGNVYESLRKFNDRAGAVSAGLKKGAKFINTSGVATPTTGWIIDTVME